MYIVNPIKFNYGYTLAPTTPPALKKTVSKLIGMALTEGDVFHED